MEHIISDSSDLETVESLSYSKNLYLKSNILSILDTIELESWEVYALYFRFIDSDIIHHAISRLSYESRVHRYTYLIDSILQDAVKYRQWNIVESMMNIYNNDLKDRYIYYYKTAFVNRNDRMFQLLLQHGYIPPPHTQSINDIKMIILDGIADRERLLYYRDMEQQQQDYFIGFTPLQTNIKNDTPLAVKFLICHDKDRLCGTLVYYQDDNNYVISEFVTRTIMDPIYHGTGKRIIQRLIDEALQNKIDRIVLISSTPAIGFYRKMGFQSSDAGEKYMYLKLKLMTQDSIIE